MRVLITDDEQKNLILLRDFLTGLGHDVIAAENGKIALEMARANPPEIIISDILMPVMDGFKLCQEWKKDSRLKNIPFIFYTATYTLKDDKKFALSLGADRFVEKPISMKRLIEIVNEVITDSREGKLVATKRPEVTDETAILKEHFARMSGKLEDKLVQLEQAKQVIHESEEKFRAIAHNAMDAIILIDNEGCVSYWNPAAEKVFGYKSEEAIGKQLHQLLAPKHYHETFQKGFKSFKKTGKGAAIGRSSELRAVRKSGAEFPIELSLSAIKLKGKWNALGIVRDISERKRAEKELNSLAKFPSENPNPVLRVSKDGTILYANKGASPLLNAWGCQVNQQLPEYWRNYVLEIYSSGVSKDIEIKCGQSTFSITFSPIVDTGYINLYGLDITKRIQTETELHKLSLAVEQSQVSIVITDTRGNIEYINPKFTEVTGYTYEEAIGQNPRILKSGEHPPELYKQLWDTITSGKEWSGELHNKRKDGELYWEKASISPIKNTEGVITHFLAVKEDITEQKRLERQLIQAQKMEAIGNLAGGVAHDFNNLLGVIIGYSDVLLTKISKGEQTGKFVEEIRKAGRQAASLTHQLLSFSRRQVLQPEVLDMNTIVIDIKKMLERLIGEDIELITDFGSELDPVKADRGQVGQVLMNLALNARDAMPEGGRITIKTENVALDEKYCKTYSYARPGMFVCLSVTDTGIGMGRETISHIFEPFFTTKKEGQGTGLGLSVIYGIVKQHEGWINVYSEPGQGSVFRVYFPASSVSRQARAEEEIPLDGLQGSGERVLLVEDEEMLRDFTVGVLRENGYEVFEARNAEEALDFFKREKGDFNLVFSDTVLPDKTGIELVDQLLSLKPDLKVLMTSGYLDKKSRWSIIQQRGFNFLPKPYTLADLLRALKEVVKSE
jgi:PAS domain S-box-containing protein